jgi:Mrp family chromosome partitioning ATPase
VSKSVTIPKISEPEIIRKLESVTHPEIPDQNLVKLGMIPEVQVQDDRVLITLALPSINASIKQVLIEAVKKGIADIVKELNVEVIPVEMDQAQRQEFMWVAGKVQRPVRPKGKIDKLIAVMSGKGGVGKSSVAGLLASSLQRMGLKVGVLDADITGPSIPRMFGVNQPPVGGPDGISPVISHTGIKLMSTNFLLPSEDQPVVWRGPMISRAIEQFWSDIIWGNLDYLVVDLPPGTSDAALTVIQSLPLDGVILVTSPQDLAGMVVRKAANMVTKLGVRIVGLIENMSKIICPHCGMPIEVFGPSQAQHTADLIQMELLGHMPLDPQLATLCDQGLIEKYMNNDFDSIVKRVVHRMPIKSTAASLEELEEVQL